MASSDPIDPAKAALERARAAARAGGPAPSTSNKRSTAPPPRGTGFGRDPVLVGEAVGDVLAERGWLQLSFLDIGDQPAATYFCFDYGRQILVYNSGYDPQASPQLSSGWVLLSRLIQDAIGQGRERFDFLQGNEDYKYRFGGVDTPVHRTLIHRA